VNLAFSTPWVLGLALAAIIPWLRSGHAPRRYSSLTLVPDDAWSRWLERLLRGVAAAAVVFLALGMAGLHQREQWVERVGTGARIVLLVDHSSSMNENFAGRYLGGKANESKSALAAQLLAEFVARRGEDLFAVISFSAAPIYVLPLTQDHAAVLAAIKALGGRGHGLTHIAPGLAMALGYFDGQPQGGGRVILLVSDGAARMIPETADAIRQAFQDRQVSLYWIYLRNPKGGHLSQAPQNANESTTPEYFLHGYFQTLGVPYQAYEAENPEAVRQAIAALEKLENQPLRYQEKLPRKDFSNGCYLAALLCLLILLAAQALAAPRVKR
jgi:mxaC protein